MGLAVKLTLHNSQMGCGQAIQQRKRYEEFPHQLGSSGLYMRAEHTGSMHH